MKTALVTGAMGGIGFATVNQLILDGFTVIGTDITPATDAKQTVDDSKFFYISSDISKEKDRIEIVEYCISNTGKIDVLVNVAGVAPKVRNDLLDMSQESFDFVMNINTKATMFLTQLVAKEMIKNTEEKTIKGHIVNISSMSAYTSSVNRGEYCISKAGVSMITKLFADRLAEENILVNEIRPGIISTGMTSSVKEKYDKLIASGIAPIKRWGMPEDVANMVSILCSDKIGYTTGQSIDVDGGFHMMRL